MYFQTTNVATTEVRKSDKLRLKVIRRYHQNVSLNLGSRLIHTQNNHRLTFRSVKNTRPSGNCGLKLISFAEKSSIASGWSISLADCKEWPNDPDCKVNEMSFINLWDLLKLFSFRFFIYIASYTC